MTNTDSFNLSLPSDPPPTPSILSSEHIKIWSINVRGLFVPNASGGKMPSRNKAELDARLNCANVQLVCVQETWLDDTIEEVSFTNYRLVVRLDRAHGKVGYGGVAIFAHTSFHAVSSHFCSVDSERIWCILHTNCGNILIGNWYRAPDDSDASVRSLSSELQSLRSEFIGAVILGDPNIHHRKWLVHSRDNSAIGELLHKSCLDTGLKQIVRKPTRPNLASGTDYLLDIVLTDLQEFLTVSVLPQVADHRVVEVAFDAVIPTPKVCSRTVWNFKQARWHSLSRAIRDFDWDGLFSSSPELCAFALFSDTLLCMCREYIGQRQISVSKREHPWLDDACLSAIDRKCRATASDTRAASADCARVLTDSFLSYQHGLKVRLQSLPKSSKLWWRYNRELLNRKSKCQNVCHLKRADGEWVYDPQLKSDLFASVFRSKSKLPSTTRMRSSVVPVLPVSALSCAERNAELCMSDFCVIRTRWVLKVLAALQDCACGPDGIPSKVLFKCRKDLAPIIARLIRKMLTDRCWPSNWRLHWLCPLFKRGSHADANNYRGVHLTPILSKVVERVLAMHLVRFLDCSDAYGPNQWAFRSKRSCRDLVTLLVCSWLRALRFGRKIALYLSDISGAFDKVDRDIMIARLRISGVSDAFCELICSYLEARQASVVVQGCQSKPYKISNQVFQGTVLGPPLWNCFFKSVSEIIISHNYTDAKFADDLSAYREYASAVPNAQILSDLHSLQFDVHAWGFPNRVSFDVSKEHFVVLHKRQNHGDDFKLLGAMIDTKLSMSSECQRVRKKAGPKAKAILATKGFYNTRDLVVQFKSHVWCHLEFSTGAVYHAADTHLRDIDSVQDSFIHALGLSEKSAFLDFKLPPLCLRRDIAVLGLLHKIVLGFAHPMFVEMFPMRAQVHIHAHDTRYERRRHGKQFVEHSDGGQSGYFSRSVFAACRVYNFLPAYAVQTDSVKAFQKLLTRDARFACQTGRPDWPKMYSCRPV